MARTLVLPALVLLAGCSLFGEPLHPLPEGIAGIPRPGPFTAELGPESRPGTFPHGVAQPFRLGHCALGSPIDVDGSLWSPIGGHDGTGGPLTDAQLAELSEATPMTLTIVSANRAELRTPGGGVVVLERLPGERRYALCD